MHLFTPHVILLSPLPPTSSLSLFSFSTLLPFVFLKIPHTPLFKLHIYRFYVCLFLHERTGETDLGVEPKRVQATQTERHAIEGATVAVG